MPRAKVTSKGQITIPVEMRRKLKIKTGTEVVFFDAGDGSYTMRAKTGSIEDLRGCLAHDGPAWTIEEMNQAVGEYVSALDRATMSDAQAAMNKDEAA